MSFVKNHAVSDKFLNKLMKIAIVSATNAFNCLKSIFYLQGSSYDAYDDALLLFKNTWESTRLTLFNDLIRWSLISQLLNFKKFDVI